ncbi:hypothetical protein B4098_2774 [Heyndrickxia coagulans]|uniref:Uncharacterized protein n=1 Tax=Heyndrickxia coagulans TaxID=1398 RepID=A0A150K413_HEYCO|nr:hypothetical protein B4098_2774 [Heyndrickxia coagulans]
MPEIGRASPEGWKRTGRCQLLIEKTVCTRAQTFGVPEAEL